MRRGTLVLVAIQGDYGKPRPALVVQSTLFEDLPSVVVCPLTSTLRDDAPLLRIDITPSEGNGLRASSQVAVDKITVVSTSKVGAVIGTAEDEVVTAVTRSLAVFLGIA